MGEGMSEERVVMKWSSFVWTLEAIWLPQFSLFSQVLGTQFMNCILRYE